MIRRILTLVIPVALLVACAPAGSGTESQGGGGGESTGPGASQAAASAPAASSGGGGGGGGGGSLASADVTITGGEFAGHYQVELIGSGGCSTGVVGPDSFAVASVTLDPAGAFGGPQISLYDAAAAASGDDSQFSAAFPFNNYADTLEINPYLSAQQGSNFGSGTATLDNRGDTATVTIEGTTANGETISATIECHQVANY